MEIKINAKFPGRGDVNFEFSCTEQETAMLIQDPVYQRLGEVVIEQIRRYGTDDGGHWRDMRHKQSQNYHDNNHKANHAQPNDRVEYLRRVVETEHKCQANHNKAVDAALKSLQDQFSRALDRIIKS